MTKESRRVAQETEMIEHKIYARHSGVGKNRRLPIPLIKHCIRVALEAEGVNVPCEISVLITSDNAIQELNRQYREKDKPTDVLSFPMQELVPGEFSADESAVSPETGLLPLGDIILSADTVYEQAARFRQSAGRESGYLAVHSVLHLLGYDHVDEGADKRKMRRREKIILTKAGFSGDEIADEL